MPPRGVGSVVAPRGRGTAVRGDGGSAAQRRRFSGLCNCSGPRALAFFRPNPKVIKRRIEALIDREYLERDPEVANAYRYLA